MKRKKTHSKRQLLWICIIVVALAAVLLAVLVSSESRAEGATITSTSSGLWYLLTTLTTVGYGDTYPVTSAGRAVGTVFQLLSLGVLAVLFGTILSLFRGKLVPFTKLTFRKNKKWFLFHEQNSSSEKLAAHLIKDDPDAVIVFCNADDSEASESGITVSADLPQVLEKKGSKGKAFAFFMNENMAENERNAKAVQSDNTEVFIMSKHEPLTIIPHHHLFNPYDCCARLYWHKYPSEKTNENLVLIGGGKYAFALLEQALMQNVISDHQHITYRMFGDFDEFKRVHPYLNTCFSLNEADPNRDNLFFCEQPWNKEHSILKKADRILVCFDEEAAAMDVLTSLFRYVPVTGKVYARLSNPYPGCVTFGSDDEIFTEQLVMKNKLNETAIRLHRSYVASAPGKLPDWVSLNPFLRRSNLASADHLRYKARYLIGTSPEKELTSEDYTKAFEQFCSLNEEEKDRCRKIEHDRWMRFHVLNNWQYAPVRDNDRRLHPLLLPFEDLSPEDQAKDDHAWELLGKLPMLLE